MHEHLTIFTQQATTVEIFSPLNGQWTLISPLSRICLDVHENKWQHYLEMIKRNLTSVCVDCWRALRCKLFKFDSRHTMRVDIHGRNWNKLHAMMHYMIWSQNKLFSCHIYVIKTLTCVWKVNTIYRLPLDISHKILLNHQILIISAKCITTRRENLHFATWYWKA